MTHTHTIESGNARVSVEADDANLAVSEARRNWELNNGGDTMSETVDDIARRIAEKIAAACESEFSSISHRFDWTRDATQIVSNATFHLVSAELAPLIQRAEAAERVAPKWISVDEGVPANYDPVLVHRSHATGFTDVARWTGDAWKNYNWHRDLDRNEISHWMPLPALPAAKEGT